jgi:hypothetical protein
LEGLQRGEKVYNTFLVAVPNLKSLQMKKRGHKPSSQTITILLRGYMENMKRPNVVKQALTVYNSIFASNSSVKPSIIHTNAVLAVCSRGHDMDSIWSIVGRLPDRGPDAADHRTYTTILSAITADARDRALKLGSKEQERSPDDRSLNTETIFERAVEDGRRLWTEITSRWRRGDLEIDTKLVCAMGRLLMLSSQRRHHQEILSLVGQTMNISAADEKLEASRQEMAPQTNVDSEPSPSSPGEAQPLPGDSPKDGDTGSFGGDTPNLESPSKALSLPNSSIFATPDKNTLSMLIETTTSLKELEAGRKYWRICTSATGPYNIKPDAENITAYLRLLRVSRASRETLDVLRTIPFDIWRSHLSFKGVFVIAMSTCVRDKNNPNVFDTASRILDLMQQNLQRYAGLEEEEAHLRSRRIAENLSPKVLTSYVQLAMSTTRGLNGEKLTKDKKSGDLNFERDARKNNVLRALNRLTPETMNVKQMIKIHVAEYERQLNDGSRTPTVQRMLREQAAVPEPTKELMEYLTVLISAYDKLLMINEQLEDEGLGPLDVTTLTDINLEKRKLSSFVGMVNNVPGMSSKYEKIKQWLEPPENGGYQGRRMSREMFTPQSRSNDSIESSAQREIKEEIENKGKKEDTRKILRGLSVRQKHELQKEMHIRANFPTSLERPPSKASVRMSASQHVAQRRPRSVNRELRSTKMPMSKEGFIRPPRFAPARRIPRATHSLSQVEDGGMLEQSLHSESSEQRYTEQVSRPPNKAVRKSHARPYANLPKVDGWGGGFEELARKQGQSPSDFLDLANK